MPTNNLSSPSKIRTTLRTVSRCPSTGSSGVRCAATAARLWSSATARLWRTAATRLWSTAATRLWSTARRSTGRCVNIEIVTIYICTDSNGYRVTRVWFAMSFLVQLCCIIPPNIIHSYISTDTSKQAYICVHTVSQRGYAFNRSVPIPIIIES